MLSGSFPHKELDDGLWEVEGMVCFLSHSLDSS